MNQIKYLYKETEGIQLRRFGHFIRREDTTLNKEVFNWIPPEHGSEENQN